MGRAVYLRLGSSLVALAAGAAGVVVVVALLRSEPGPVGAATATPIAGAPAPPVASVPIAGGRIPTPNDPRFPSPPPGAIVLAREAGSDALGLAVVPGRPRSLVRVSVVSPNGPGAAGLAVSVAFGGLPPVSLPACGAGCYQAQVETQGSREVSVRIGARSFGFTLPANPDPPDGTATVRRATVVWRALQTLVWHERLGSSPTDIIHTVYQAVAPNRLSYTISGLSAAIIIGGLRWDRPTPTAAWVRSVQDPALRVPTPFWYSEYNARVLGSSEVAGRPVWTVSFFDPTTPAWFEAEIDKGDGRTLKLSMIAASHFMYDAYGPFNAAIRIRPPVPGE